MNMKKLMNKGFVILFFVAAIAQPLCGMESATQAMHKTVPSVKETTSLEWVEITSENISTMEPFFEKLKPVYMSAFRKPGIACMQEKHPEKFRAIVATGEGEKIFEQAWEGNLDSIKMCLTQGLGKIHCAIIKNPHKEILGFSFFLCIPQTIVLTAMKMMGKTKEILWVKEHQEETTANNEVFLHLLAVRADCHGRGLGRQLVFSILSHSPQIKKIYLFTDASKANEDAHHFYEHCGFECMAIKIDNDGDQDRMYEFNSR